MDASIPSLLQFGEHGEHTRRTTTAQLTFRQPLGRALGRCCFRSIGLQLHSQQCLLKVIADEFAPSVHGMV